MRVCIQIEFYLRVLDNCICLIFFISSLGHECYMFSVSKVLMCDVSNTRYGAFQFYTYVHQQCFSVTFFFFFFFAVILFSVLHQSLGHYAFHSFAEKDVKGLIIFCVLFNMGHNSVPTSGA